MPAGDVTPWARVLLDVRHGGQHAAHPGQEGVWAHLMEVQRAQAWPHEVTRDPSVCESYCFSICPDVARHCSS